MIPRFDPSQRRPIRRMLQNCRALRMSIRRLQWTHGQAVARGFGTPTYHASLLQNIRWRRAALNSTRVEMAMYRTLRAAA